MKIWKTANPDEKSEVMFSGKHTIRSTTRIATSIYRRKQRHMFLG